MKRLFDLSVVILTAPLWIPVLLGIAILLRITIGSPVFFRQQRPGFRGRPFSIIKFRTMEEGQDSDGAHLPDEVRMTGIGRFLRASSLDELPELFNVLRGDMSLVGPRPLLLEYLPLYSPEQARRHDVHPGITGWAQVMGRNAISWEEKFALDLWYVDHRSLWLDLKILARTAGAVLSRRGVNQPGRATVDRFRGSNAPGPDRP